MQTVPANTVVEAAVTKQDHDGNPLAATVPVKSAWLSKINWTQAAMAATAIVTATQLDIPADYKPIVLMTLNVLQGGITWVMRTWFNGSVSSASITPPVA